MHSLFVAFLILSMLFISVTGGLVEAQELEVASGGSTADCESKMQEYLVERIGQDDFDENKEIMKEDFLNKCEELSIRDAHVMVNRKVTEDSTNVKGKVLDELPALTAKLKKREIDDRLRENGFLVNGEHSLVVFATERIEKDLINSFFASIPEGDANNNECENSLYKVFAKKDFVSKLRKFNKTQRMNARAFRTVFGRYKDLSYMPNDSTVKAASIVDRSARAVITCDVDVDIDELGEHFEACARGRCKAVDVTSKKRIATADDLKCEENENKTTAYIGAIRFVCEKMGRELGANLVKIYSNR